MSNIIVYVDVAVDYNTCATTQLMSRLAGVSAVPTGNTKSIDVDAVTNWHNNGITCADIAISVMETLFDRKCSCATVGMLKADEQWYHMGWYCR